MERTTTTWPVWLIVLIPILLALPQLSGYLLADPLYYRANVASGVTSGLLDGQPSIDPNDGFQTHALGYRAARDWLKGIVPWWNAYSGVGLPLAAEYQPAAFFPLTFLLLLPKGMVLQQLALQILAGLGTYGLLRQIGLGRHAALLGGILYSFNGTLAWVAHGPAQPVPFLPWTLWGIERARCAAESGQPGGWRMLAAALAMSLLAGFPETAFISGLLALAWAIARGGGLRGASYVPFARRVALGGIVALALAAPQVVAFFTSLQDSEVFGHASGFEHGSIPSAGILQGLVAPYIHGPIYSIFKEPLWSAWGTSGGYATIALVIAATYGFMARRDAIGWLLAAWIVLVLAKTYGAATASALWNLVPGIGYTAFWRYAQPSWELAMVVLAARGLHDAASFGPRPAALATAAALPFAAIGAAVAFSGHLHDELTAFSTTGSWAIAAAIWALVTALACVSLLARATRRGAAVALMGILILDAVVMFTIPRLTYPRAGRIDEASLRFLRDNLGHQRFFSMGPIAPNYGAYFGLASIDHNYLPVPRRWSEFIRKRLDSLNDSEVFNGERWGGPRSSTAELSANAAAYRWIGVKYVVIGREHDLGRHLGLPLAHDGEAMRIYALGGESPYFEAIGARCRVEGPLRTEPRLDCDGPATLVRRELHFPGWEARVNGKATPIEVHAELFQAVAVPAGKSEVRFSYAPPHIGWAWLAMALSAAALAVSLARRRPRLEPRS